MEAISSTQSALVTALVKVGLAEQPPAEPPVAIRCRAAAMELPEAFDPAKPFMYLPEGISTITATRLDKPVTVTVKVTPAAAAAVQASFKAYSCGPQKPFLDFEHDEAEASAWPKGFEWRTDPQPGVYVIPEWSAAGEAAVRGKNYRSFSPAVFVDADWDSIQEGSCEIPAGKRGSPQNPAVVYGADFCMGGLVNRPAFHRILPLWAKSADSSSAETKPQPKEEGETTMPENTQQAAANPSAEEIIALRAKAAKADALEGEVQSTRKSIADAAVKAAVARGAIAPKDTALQAKWAGLIIANPQHQELLEALPVAAPVADRVTAAESLVKASGIETVRCDVKDAVKAYMGARAAKPFHMDRSSDKVDARECARSAGLIFARDIAPVLAKQGGYTPKDLLKASDVTDVNVGTLAGTLILQQSVQFLKNFLLPISRISTDISGQPIGYGQSVVTRLRSAPNVTDYSTTTGWSDSTPSAMDIPVIINKHKGVQLTFNTQTLASTVRNLFAEQAEPMAYALANQITTDLISNITVGNFSQYFQKALVDVNRLTLVDVGSALDDALVPPMERTALLHHSYYNKLKEDPSLVSYLYTGQVETLTKGSLPEVDGLLPLKSQLLTDGANLKGFAFGPSALAFAARVPNDYTTIWPDLPPTGIVEIVTEPETGISLMWVRFISHNGAHASARAAIMYGSAKGQAAAGVRIVAAGV